MNSTVHLLDKSRFRFKLLACFCITPGRNPKLLVFSYEGTQIVGFLIRRHPNCWFSHTKAPKLLVFSYEGTQIVGFLIRRHPNCWFSHTKAHIIFSSDQYGIGCLIDKNMSCIMRKPTLWFLNRSDTNRAVQAQKMARGWKFWV